MKIRECNASTMATGHSGCQLDFGKVVAAIIVPDGTKLPADLDGDSLEELCHASRATRVYPLSRFVEYSLGGGDMATSAVGYGATSVNGVNARTDTYTFDKYREVVAASLMRTANNAYGVYYIDENNVIYGINDGTDVLAPFDMSTIYPTATPHPTSGAQATLLVNFCHLDARKAIEKLDFEQLSFDPVRYAKGLVPVKFVKAGTGANTYKLVESVGGYDRSEEFGALISGKAADVLNGATAAAYADGVFTMTLAEGSAGVTLKSASVLYENGIKFIEQA